MNKTILKVFGVVGILVGIFLAWQLIFNDGGILKTGYNAVAKGINTQWKKVAGQNADNLVAEWTDNNAADNGTAFDINTSVNGNNP